MRSAYRSVLMVWSADDPPGDTVAIMVVRARLEVKQSLRIRVSLLALYGTCFELPPRARIHSLSASKEVLISELSVLLWRLCDLVSLPLSLPAKSTRLNFPLRDWVSLSRSTIWQMACDLELVSFASVAWVVRFLQKEFSARVYLKTRKIILSWA